jgi:hypothetical protein
MSNPDPILPVVLTVTVYPPKKGKRMVVVSGAPEGEMPLLLTGLFQDRHALLDQAYAQCLKRDPQLVTIAEPKAKPGKSKSVTAGTEDDDEEVAEGTDQLVEVVPVSPIIETDSDEELPAIEGDLPLPVGESRGEGESTLEEEEHGQQD